MLRAVFKWSLLMLVLLIFFVTKISGRKWRQPKEDTFAQRQAAKIIHMFRELILDMQRKIEGHYLIKKTWRDSRRYQTAETVFAIKKKVSVLRRILRQNLVWDNVKNEYLILNRTEHPEKDYMAVKDMARCQYESLEIDKLIHMVQKFQWAKLNSSNIASKYAYPLRTNNNDKNENKKQILREKMKNIHKNQENGLNKLVEKLEDIPEVNLKGLLEKIGDVPQNGTKHIGDMRREGIKNVKKMADRIKKTSDDPKYPADGFGTDDDDEAWK